MRNITTSQTTFLLDQAGDAPATFIIPVPVSSSNSTSASTDTSNTYLKQVTMIIPPRSKYTPSPHWHERHVEIFRVLQGRILLIRDGVSNIVTKDDGDQRVEKGVVHEFMRADVHASEEEGDDGDAVVLTTDEPDDGVKEVFFRNLFSTVQDSKTHWGSWTYLQLLLVAANYDEYVVLVPGRLSWLVTHTLYYFLSPVAKIAGLSPWYEEYTPERLRNVAKTGGWSKSKIL